MYLLFVIFGFASVASRSSSSSAYPSQLFVSNISADFIKLVWSLCVKNSFYALFIPHTCSWTTLRGLLPTEVVFFLSFFFIRVIFHSFESCPEGAEYASRVSSVHVDWGQIFSRAQICWLQADSTQPQLDCGALLWGHRRVNCYIVDVICCLLTVYSNLYNIYSIFFYFLMGNWTIVVVPFYSQRSVWGFLRLRIIIWVTFLHC